MQLRNSLFLKPSCIIQTISQAGYFGAVGTCIEYLARCFRAQYESTLAHLARFYRAQWAQCYIAQHRYERQVAQACLAVICLYCTTNVLKNRVSQLPNRKRLQKGEDNGAEYVFKMINKECNVRLLKGGVHLMQCTRKNLRVILMK